MPSTSPGIAPPTASTFAQILPGAPTEGLQSLTSFVFRQKRYVAYISGCQLNILSAPNVLVHAVTFEESLRSIAVENDSSKIAVASTQHIWVLDPIAQGWTKVRWQTSMLLLKDDSMDGTRTLSWGNEGEMLVGGEKALSLYSALPTSRSSTPPPTPSQPKHVERRHPVWTIAIPNPVEQCCCSPSASLIASRGTYDKLVKIWRRLSFEEGLFDYAYLPHPATVTSLQWRLLDEQSDIRRGSGIRGRHDEDPEVLYTIAADGILRVWRTGGAQELVIMVLFTSINLVDAIPETPSAKTNDTLQQIPSRYAIVISSADFGGAVASALNSAVGILNNGKISHSLEHLKHVSSKEADIVVAMDARGRMSAWGLQSIGHKRRPETPGSKEPFHVAHAEDLPIKLGKTSQIVFNYWIEHDTLHVVAHNFDGSITWWQGSMENFFSPSAPGRKRLQHVALWTGHELPVSRLRCRSGQLLSQDQTGSELAWHMQSSGLITGASPRRERLVYRRDSILPADLATDTDRPSLVASNDTLAVVVSADGKELTTFDVRGGYLEHRCSYSQTIRHVRLGDVGTEAMGLLAVVFGTHADVLVRGRCSTTTELFAWRRVMQISLTSFDLDLAILEFLDNGKFAIAAGNGIYMADPVIELAVLDEDLKQLISHDVDEMSPVTLTHISTLINTPLPVWHPSVLYALVQHDRTEIALRILDILHYKLKFYGEGDELDAFLGLDAVDLLVTSPINAELDPAIFTGLLQQLEENRLPYLPDIEQDRLKVVIETLAFIQSHLRGLDACARLYLATWKFKGLQLQRSRQAEGTLTNGTSDASQTHPTPRMSWSEIAFAYHSKTQQPLLDLLYLHHDNKINWEISGLLGIMRWLDHGSLAHVFESIGQSEYRATDPPDPVNAALFYLALGKKQTLLALWRIATWHKEQRSTMNFLRRDFALQESKTAARKNAYALMGKRRFRYAAAFFLLAEDAPSAINILAGQCEDIPLAVAVARLYCGDGSPELCGLLESRPLPRAREKGDRWLTSWAMALMGRKEEAAEALVEPITDVMKQWQQDDPLTLKLYAVLRSKETGHEWRALLRVARVLSLQGVDFIATVLLSSWNFEVPKQNVVQSAGSAAVNGVHSVKVSELSTDTPGAGLPSALDGFMSPVSAPQPQDEKAAREAKAAELLKKLQAKKAAQQQQKPADAMVDEKKPQPTQFKEPDPNSLLDSFGF